MMDTRIVQYIVVRSDLLHVLKWSVGALLAQVGHACTAVCYLYRNDNFMKEYVKNIDSMIKIVLKVESQTELLDLSEYLNENDVVHKLWIENPENVPTCIVTKPYPKCLIEKFFKHLKLMK